MLRLHAGRQRSGRRPSTASVTYALYLSRRRRPHLEWIDRPRYCGIRRGQPMRPMFPMQALSTFLLLALAGCTSASSGTGGPAPGSDAWYETASPEKIANYFRSQCVTYGYLPGTPEMAECIGKEASAAKQTHVARSAAIAAAAAGY